MTIKIIDLLNKIANRENAPEKIKYNGTEYKLNEITGWYQNIDEIGSVNEWFVSKYRLNDTVEILEEQQDIDIQEIKYLNELSDCEERNIKINELVQAVKQLDKQIKEKE